MYINWFTWIICTHDRICYTKISGIENDPYSLNVMVNYHYHSKNRAIIRKFPSMMAKMVILQFSIWLVVKVKKLRWNNAEIFHFCREQDIGLGTIVV